MLDNLNNYKIILGSNSPRRKELLAGLGIDFEVRTITGIDETYPETLEGEDVPIYIAKKKAEAYLDQLADDELLITGDTIVWTFKEVLGKPADREEAIQMLSMLSGHVHEVVTGMCIATKEKSVTFAVSSAVCFADLSKEEIEHYVDKFHPYDKAGAYGIQEWIGYVGVEAINGSFYNVMGMPIQRLYRELQNF